MVASQIRKECYWISSSRRLSYTVLKSTSITIADITRVETNSSIDWNQITDSVAFKNVKNNLVCEENNKYVYYPLYKINIKVKFTFITDYLEF